MAIDIMTGNAIMIEVFSIKLHSLSLKASVDPKMWGDDYEFADCNLSDEKCLLR